MTINRSINSKAIVATSIAVLASISPLPQTTIAFAPPTSSTRTSFTTTQINVVGEQATSIGPAQVLRKLKQDLPQIEWLAEGDAPA